MKQISFFVQRTIRWNDKSKSVNLIDQTLLPNELRYIECNDVSSLITAIKTMQIRGAPAIGVAGAMGVALAAEGVSHDVKNKSQLILKIERDAKEIADARPTAVNLAWGVKQALDYLESMPDDTDTKIATKKLIAYAKSLADKDVEINKKLARIGQGLIANNARILTHCN